MTTNYTRRTPIDETPARCYPSTRMDACYLCTRWRIGQEPPAELRENDVIDGSVIWVGGSCGMYDPRPAVRPFSEVEA